MDPGRAVPSLRPATAADAEFLAWGLQEAADGVFTTLFGRPADSILATVMAQPTHDLSFQHAVIAESDGVGQGMCSGMPYGTPSVSGAFVRAAGIRSVRAAAILVAGWPLFAAFDRHAPGEWYLLAIAVRGEARGLGVGRILIDDAFSRAAGSGCTAVTLDVDVANVRARALYERLGFQVTATSRAARLLDGAQVHRMAAEVPGCKEEQLDSGS